MTRALGKQRDEVGRRGGVDAGVEGVEVEVVVVDAVAGQRAGALVSGAAPTVGQVREPCVVGGEFALGDVSRAR